MDFLFVVAPCLVIIGVAALLLGSSIGVAIGLILRSFWFGFIGGVIFSTVAIMVAGAHFLRGYRTRQGEVNYALYGRPAFPATFELALILVGCGVAILVLALIVWYRIGRYLKTYPAEEPFQRTNPSILKSKDQADTHFGWETRDERAFCYLCGRKLQGEDLSSRVCGECRY